MTDITIHEVGPRDGLQVEKIPVPLERKIAWIEGLLEAGLPLVQAGAFVNPEKVPQMADTDAIFRYFQEPGRKRNGAMLSGLVLNEKGLERGMACGVDMFCMGVSASETHSMKNTGMTPAQALDRIIPMARQALAAGCRVQVSVQSAFGCGFDGPVPAERVLTMIKKYLEAGLTSLSLADTAGHAHPAQVAELFQAITDLAPGLTLAAHFHNTYGLGLANCYAARRAGATLLESSFGGLGGCPFTKVPAGNVSTEDLVHSLQREGACRTIDLGRILAVAREVAAFFERDLPGFILKSGSIIHLYQN